MASYFIGQRVLVDGNTIAVIIQGPPNQRQIDRDNEVWVKLPSGIEQYRAPHNVKPLPNGQL